MRVTARASFYSGQSRDLEALPISGAFFRPSLINNHYQPLWPLAMVQYFHFYAGTLPPQKNSNIENALWIKKICSDYLLQSHIDQENFLHGRLTLHSTIPPWRRPEGHILSGTFFTFSWRDMFSASLKMLSRASELWKLTRYDRGPMLVFDGMAAGWQITSLSTFLQFFQGFWFPEYWHRSLFWIHQAGSDDIAYGSFKVWIVLCPHSTGPKILNEIYTFE